MDGAHVSHRATHAHRADYSPVKTHKNQSFSSHKPSNGKTIMFFVIPEMPSKTFVMGLKKLPDHLKNYLFYWGFSSGEGNGNGNGQWGGGGNIKGVLQDSCYISMVYRLCTPYV